MLAAAVVALGAGLSSCSAGYVLRSAWYQAEMLGARVPIEKARRSGQLTPAQLAALDKVADIKAFGKGGPDFEAAAVQVATEALGADRVGVQVRTTPSGTRQCVTLTLQARTVEDVETVYARLFALPDLLLIL